MTAAATRQRLLSYIQALPDDELDVVAELILPSSEPESDQVRDPQIFSAAESEVRLREGLRQADAGKTVPLEEFLRRRNDKRQARVQG